MIFAYTTNETNAEEIKIASGLKGYKCNVFPELDSSGLITDIENASVLIFDLTCASMSTDRVINTLDSIDSDSIPPVLYILSNPADIEFITESGSIINQDYTFTPIDPNALAARLEVLKMLGDRRKLSMETAITDRLTGLYNRKYFIRRLEEELYRSSRYNYHVGILLAAIDFSADGQPLTEKAGTEVIKRIAAFFKGRLRKSDIVSRFKWDDFAFLLPDISPEDSVAVASDVKTKLEALPIRADDLVIKLRVYIGHVCFPVNGLTTAVDVLDTLDDCCFKAKTTDGVDIITYTPNNVSK